MRQMLSRAFTLGGLVGILAAGTAALALPGTSTGRPAATEDRLLETITVPAGQSTWIPSQTDFAADKTYRFDISGTIHRQCTASPDYNWNGDAFYTYGGEYSKPNPQSTLDATLRQGTSTSGEAFYPGFFDPPGLPAFSDGHVYSFVISPDSWPNGGFHGTISFLDAATLGPLAHDCPGTGHWTVKVSEVLPETVDFGVHHTSHTVLSHRSFVLTTTKGLGQLEVPAPKTGETVSSTKATGAIKFSVLKFSPHNVLLLDESTLSLRVTKGYFSSDTSRSFVLLDVTVSKSKGDKPCGVGQTGRVLLLDSSAGNDALKVLIPGCHINASFVDGQERTTVTVGIHVEQPPAPPRLGRKRG